MPGCAVDVFGAEQFVTRRADVLDVKDGLGHDFALNIKVEVVDVRIANACREDDSGQVRQIGIGRIPASDVAAGLRLPGRTLVGVAAGSARVNVTGTLETW